jgi:hypothetical protein
LASGIAQDELPNYKSGSSAIGFNRASRYIQEPFSTTNIVKVTEKFQNPVKMRYKTPK